MSPKNLIFEIYTNALKSLLISVPKKKSADKLGLNVRKNNLTFKYLIYFQ
jgi:hypothetical protein